ncbi:MAG: hypothetical protein M1840_008669 [Geoglossum simile]|nr:MAG: hypothetical protein M1840_008669 [Geoglossum simile]
MHLFITSRHTTSIDREFETASRPEISSNDADVRKYLEHRIASEPQLVRHIKKDPTLRDTTINSLAGKARGIDLPARFLLAQLQMDSLAKKDNLKAIRKALPNMPSELDGVYGEAMQRIRGQNHKKARRAEQVLSWISFALRPVTVTEIQHALAVEKGDVTFGEDAMPDEDVLVSVCAGLVIIDRESNIIRLVHYTTQEYFERIRTAQFPDAETAMATARLVYISFDVFAKGHCRSDGEMGFRMNKYPLLEYAVRNWGHHASWSLEGEIQELALNFLDHDLKIMCAIQVMHLPRYRYRGYSQSFPEHVTGLHIVASNGLAKLAPFLLERRGVDVNSKDSNKRGHEAVVRLLFEHEDIDVNFKDIEGLTPLSCAAINGHEAVVQLLTPITSDP